MTDKCGRSIDYIRISVTDRCNLRCIYCMPEEGVDFLPHDQILSYEEILKLCCSFAKLGIHKVKLTGGEPLVRKNLAWLVGQMKLIEGIDSVTLTTNGILLADQMEELATAGIDSVNISLDTLKPDLFAQVTRYNRLNQVLEGIDTALQYPDVTVKINCVPIQDGGMKEQVLSLVEMARNQKLHVRFIELMPIGLGKDLKGCDEEGLKSLIASQFGTLTPYRKPLGNGPCVYYGLEGFAGKIGFISAVSHKFCDSCNRIRLTSDGFLKNCLQFSGGENLMTLLRSGISEEEMTAVIYETILKKPVGHEFGNGKQETDLLTENNLEEKRMSQIGG